MLQKQVAEGPMKSPLVVVIYDSITNSVFEGQVLQPLLVKHAPYRSVIIVSYEQTRPSEHAILKINLSHQNISLIIFERTTFDKCTTWRNARQLRSLLSTFNNYELFARGPLAARTALRARTSSCIRSIIQARGLLAHEYAYNIQPEQWTLLKRVYYYLFDILEKRIYQNAARAGYEIEAVSSALKTYLHARYSIPLEQITIAHQDIPHFFSEKTVTQWRTQSRHELSIHQERFVYCYNGSAKAWQCPAQIIQFFKERKQENRLAFLLILTQNTERFRTLCKAANLEQKDYIIRHVAHADIYRYLAACDIGIIFRENHIINWISRPTKVLEYRAVGLPIVHNSTIAWLSDSSRSDYSRSDSSQNLHKNRPTAVSMIHPEIQKHQ